MSSYDCYRDDCSQNFATQHAWSQHIRRTHNADPGTNHLTEIVLDRKRKRAEQEEEERVTKRQELETLQRELSPPEPMVCSHPYLRARY
jgi:hypothetical protein